MESNTKISATDRALALDVIIAPVVIAVGLYLHKNAFVAVGAIALLVGCLIVQIKKSNR